MHGCDSFASTAICDKLAVSLMRSVQLLSKRLMEVREVPPPQDPPPGYVTVRITAVGICGSDLHWYQEGDVGHTKGVFPRILGHEPAGEIAALGKDVTSLKVGQRVAVEPAVTCSACDYCLTNHHNHCSNLSFHGSAQSEGFFQEYLNVPVKNCLPVPDSLSLAQITLVEPLAVIFHVFEMTPARVGETVAILGSGPIGLLTAALAREAGAGKIIIGDRVPHRLEHARQMGFPDTVHMPRESFQDAVMDHTRGRGADIVFDAAAAVETINIGISALRPSGRFVLIGIPTEKQMNIDMHTAMNKELVLQMVKRSNRNDHQALHMIAAGKISELFVTHHLPLEKTPDAFEMLTDYSDGVGKIIIHP